MGTIVLKASLRLIACIYCTLFALNYYILIIRHLGVVYRFSRNLYIFYLGNFFCLYICILYLQMYHKMASSKLSHKVRELNDSPGRNPPLELNPVFVDRIIKVQIENLKTCYKCDAFMPPRAHHCKICNACYMKMDHHCTLLNICIGYKNYKCFYLFLLTNCLYSAFQLVVLLYYAIATNEMFTFYILGIFSNSILASATFVFLIFHTRHIFHNETTIEWHAINEFLNGNKRHANVFQEGPLSDDDETLIKKRKMLNPYFLSHFENVKEVFGNHYWKWPLPYHTGISNGMYFRNNCHNYEQPKY